MKVLKGLYYSKDHEWLKAEDNKVYIGITDFAQNSLGEIVYVDLPEADEEFSAGDTFGVVESVKAASDMLMPIDGKVIEVNEQLADSPELVNNDAFGSWMIAVELSDKSQLDELLSPENYETFCSKEA
ncbi:MAG: glycine cleavage system protein [Clostridiaceae bacterium]|jgi:glycine cleavage system H protein|nr:glycine cleavage system protein [Clostridiaceae bacterium]